MEYINYNIRKIFFPLAVTCFVVLLMSGCNKKETYTVTFDANGGTGTMEAQTFTEGETQVLTSNTFSYEYHTFASWNTMQDGSGTSYSDGQAINVTSDITLYAQWNHIWVDLGLPSGTKWANCNVGANSPDDYGNYYAWGETTFKAAYNWDNYTYCLGNMNSLIKYYNESSFPYGGGSGDHLITLEAGDDVAVANWGPDWRMPTETELRELKDYCVATWTTLNGVTGIIFTGQNGNSIFLPTAGIRSGGGLGSNGDGIYWSNSLKTDDTKHAWCLDFNCQETNITCTYRCNGCTVRPVYVN